MPARRSKLVGRLVLAAAGLAIVGVAVAGYGVYGAIVQLVAIDVPKTQSDTAPVPARAAPAVDAPRAPSPSVAAEPHEIGPMPLEPVGNERDGEAQGQVDEEPALDPAVVELLADPDAAVRAAAQAFFERE